MKSLLACSALSLSTLWGAAGTLNQTAHPVLWSGAVTRGGGDTSAVPECAPGCDRYDLTLNLPGGVWRNKAGGVQVGIRWTGPVFGDNLRLYVYTGNTLVAKSDGIIALAQSVLLPAAVNGDLQIYVAYDPDSTTTPIAYEGEAEVEYEPGVHPVRQLMPDLAARPQSNLSFNAVGIFFDEVSAEFPSCYQSEVNEDGAHLCFRFDQNFANTGEGPVELRFSVPTGTTPPLAPVVQRVYWSDGPAHFTDYPAGEVEFHVTHGHYHFKSFGLSRLWSVDASGKRSGAQPVRQRRTGRTIPVTLVASGRKVSFCLADTRIDFWAEKGDGPRRYNAPDCLFPATSDATTDTFVQGVNRGWGDTYDYYLPDQYIEVSGVPDGDYILDTVANPDHQLRETTEADNCISVKVRLQGMTSATPSAQLLGPGPACSSLQP